MHQAERRKSPRFPLRQPVLLKVPGAEQAFFEARARHFAERGAQHAQRGRIGAIGARPGIADEEPRSGCCRSG